MGGRSTYCAGAKEDNRLTGQADRGHERDRAIRIFDDLIQSAVSRLAPSGESFLDLSMSEVSHHFAMHQHTSGLLITANDVPDGSGRQCTNNLHAGNVRLMGKSQEKDKCGQRS